MRLGQFRENPQNPSKATEEQLERLAGKLKRVPLGLTAMRIAYVTDDPGGGKMVISGNKRLRVLKKAYGEDGEVPDEWFQDVTDMSEAERHEFIVTANVSDGDWDLDKLFEQYDPSLLEDLMGSEEVDQLLRAVRYKAECDRADDAPPAELGEGLSEPGKIYELGRHRLLCGDSTDLAQIDRLLGDRRADLVVTDPPYNIGITGKTADALKIVNDKMPDSDFQVFMDRTFAGIEHALKPGGAFYVWMADGGPDAEFELALRKTGLHQSMPLIWVKNTATFSMGRLDYNRRHEACKYGWKTGAPHYFCQDHTLTTLIQDDTPEFDKMSKTELADMLKNIYNNDVQMSVIHVDKPTANRLHPTMKPVDLIRRLIDNSSRPGETVLDLFLGSGTTVIAAEQTDRECRGIELDPKYCDVIRKRWAEYVHGEGCDWAALTPEAGE